jgi:gliding motility-associated-like protein
LKYVFLIIIVCLCKASLAQFNCANAAPFCADSGGVSFPASINVNSQIGPNYGCLLGQPNPAWYYFQVSTGGTIIIDIKGNAGGGIGYDVDFVCWGPFTNPTGNCNNLTAANIVDCSYNFTPVETCTITNAINGQFYMLLITNLLNQPQNIEFNLSPASIGNTNCGILLSGVTSKTICAGKTTTLTANSNLVNPTYAWSNSGATTVNDIVTPTATTIYTVTINGLNPVTNIPVTVTNSGTVTVLPIPTLTLASNTTYCLNDSIKLLASTGFTNYVWSGPAAYTHTTTINNTFVANVLNSNVGTYTVAAKTNFGCINTATTSVNLINVNAVTTTPNYTICPGGTLFFTNTQATGATNFNWQGPNSFTSTIQNPTITLATINQAGIYTVTANFTSGAKTCTTSNTASVTVTLPPPLILQPILAICNKGSINLNAPNGGTSYNWSGPNAFTSTLQNPTVLNASTINQGIYAVNLSNGLCVSTGSVFVQIYNPLKFDTVSSNVTICINKKGLLFAQGQGGSGFYTYNWNPTLNLNAPNNAITNVNGNTLGIINYTVTLTDAKCAITQTQSAVASVTVNANPIISFTTSNARGCQPFCTDLISTSTPTSGNCKWLFSNGIEYRGPCNTSVFCFPDSGYIDAKLILTDVNGCISSASTASFVLVDPKPKVDFSFTPISPDIIDNTVEFNDKTTVGLPITNWHWDFGDLFLTDEFDSSYVQNPKHIYENPYNYNVTLSATNSFGCTDSIIKPLKIEDVFALYIPNTFTPTRTEGKNDVFNVYGLGILSDGFEMKIFDRAGNVIYKTTDANKGWDGSVNGGKLAKEGVYIYKIKLKNYKTTEKEFVGHITIL